MKRWKYILGILALILVVAWVTKPSDEKCRQHATAAMKKKTLKTATEDELMQTMLEMVAAKGINIDDKGFYKTIHFGQGSTNTRIGWAAFGMVQIDSY